MITDILPIKNAFYTGAYAKVANDYPALQPDLKYMARLYYLRSLLAVREFNQVIRSISPSDQPELLAVQLLAKYLLTPSDSFVAQMRSLVDSNDPENKDLHVSAASLYITHGLLEDALVLLSKHNRNLEWYPCFN
jgi:hypothetical protein